MSGGWFYPRSDESDDRRDRRFIDVGAVITAATIAFFSYRQWNVYHLPEAAMALGASGAVALITPGLMRMGLPPVGAAHIIAGALTASLGTLSYMRGGLIADVMMWSLLIPLVGLLWNRRTEAIVWSLVLVGVLTALTVLDRNGYPGTAKVTGGAYPALLGMLAILMTLGLYFDRTRRRLERQTRRLERQVEVQQRLESLGRLAGGVAHDVNNLLTVTRSHAKLALGGVGREHAIAEDLRIIIETADRGATLTRDLLGLGARQLDNPTVLDPGEVVSTIRRLIARIIPETISVETEISNGDLRIVADRHRIEQVLMNLAVNARDAMPNGGTLRLSTGIVQDGDETFVRISVSDTGLGIAEDLLQRIFDPFFTTKGHEQGTGLGLATAHAVVRRSRGRLLVESKEGAGARFDVLLPATTAPTADPVSAPSVPPPLLDRPETVLVVEDERTVRRAIQRLLESRGHDVLVAETPEQAIEIAEGHEGPLDVLMTDVIMPGLSGPQVAAAVRRARPDIRVVYASGYADDDAVADEIRSGKAAFLAKPFDDKQLFEILEGGPTGSVGAFGASAAE